MASPSDFRLSKVTIIPLTSHSTLNYGEVFGYESSIDITNTDRRAYHSVGLIYEKYTSRGVLARPPVKHVGQIIEPGKMLNVTFYLGGINEPNIDFNGWRITGMTIDDVEHRIPAIPISAPRGTGRSLLARLFFG